MGLVTPGKSITGTWQYKLSSNDSWTDEVPQAVEAGQYAVYVRVKENSFYGYDDFYPAMNPIVVTIKKAEAKFQYQPSALIELEFNGQAQDLSSRGATYDGNTYGTDFSVSMAQRDINNVTIEVVPNVLEYNGYVHRFIPVVRLPLM